MLMDGKIPTMLGTYFEYKRCWGRMMKERGSSGGVMEEEEEGHLS